MPSNGSEITIRLRRSHLWAVAALLVGIGIGVLIGRATADDPQTVLYGLPATQGDGSAATSEGKPVRVDMSGSPAQGPEDAKVTMVEFVDFECPFCGRYARDTLPQVRREYGDRIRYVSRQFPLDIHPDAAGAARAPCVRTSRGVTGSCTTCCSPTRTRLASGTSRATPARPGLTWGPTRPACERRPPAPGWSVT